MKILTFRVPWWLSKIIRYSLILAVFAGFQTCQCDDINEVVPAKITTGSVSSITFNSAKCEGTFDPGTETVTEIGHCWSSTNNQPTIVDPKASQAAGSDKKPFSTQLVALASETVFYVRAYAIIAGKAYYGDLVSFATVKAPIPPPTITTNPASEVQYNSAKVGFTIQFVAGSSATQHGVCWATTSNPTVNDNKTTLGNTNGTVNAASTLSGLAENVTYYARAYAVVNTETFYGNIVTFTTSGVAPTLTTSDATEILSSSAKVSIKIQFAAGTSATQHGVCWATNNAPTTNDSKTSLGASNAAVNVVNSLTGLTAKTTYYARAYAVVNGTTYYGNVITFATSDSAPIINTGAISEIQANSAKVSFTIQLAAGTSATQHGICWATNNNPSTNDSKTSLGAANANVNTTNSLAGLATKTTYYVRAYAVVNGTTYYGNVVNFSTITDAPQTSDGAEGFLFYNSTNGQAVFGEIVNNSYRDIKALGSIGNNWNFVVPYQGMLLLIRSDNGGGALFDGKQIIKNFPGDIFLEATQVTVINNQWLLFYNSNNGFYEFGEIQNTNYKTLVKGTNFSTGWSSILSFGKDVLFYNQSTGVGTWGSFNGSSFSQYAGSEKLNTAFNAITYGNNASFWWYLRTGEAGYVYNYAAMGANKPALTEVQQIGLTFAKPGIISAGNTKNLVQMLGTQFSIYSVAADNKLTFQRTSAISTWTHLVAIKFN